MKFLITFTLILSVISTTVFAYTDYENTHRSHYDKYFFYFNPYSYGSNSKVNIAYTYTQSGSYYFGYRISQAAQALSGTTCYSSYHMDYNNYAPFNVIESSTNTNMTLTSKNYGNVDWTGQCSYQSAVKPIKLNEYFIDNATYKYSIEEYTIVTLHEMLHACGLDHYEDCGTEVMYTSVRGKNFDLQPGDIGGIYDKY